MTNLSPNENDPSKLNPIHDPEKMKLFLDTYVTMGAETLKNYLISIAAPLPTIQMVDVMIKYAQYYGRLQGPVFTEDEVRFFGSSMDGLIKGVQSLHEKKTK